MNILLDTHCFIWFVNGDKTLGSNSRHLIESSANVRKDDNCQPRFCL